MQKKSVLGIWGETGKFMYDLHITATPREFRGIFQILIPCLNKAFMKLKYSSNGNTQYYQVPNKGGGGLTKI